MRSSPGAHLALLVVALLVVAVLTGHWWWPVDPARMDLAAAATGASVDHPLGTDASGRDVLARLLAGGRVSLAVGAMAMVIAVSLGTLVGLVAGWRGGWVDTLLMRLVDTALAIPAFFVVLLALSLLGARLPVLVAIIGLTTWMGVARVVRAETRVQRGQGFVEASRALGCGSFSLVWTHVVPHLAPSLRVAATLGVGTAILTESALSYLGLGIQPPAASWGNMLSDAQGMLYTRPALAIFPGALIVVTVACVNALGHALRPSRSPAPPPA